MLKVECHVTGPLENNVLLLICEETLRCAVVDPGIDSLPLLRELALRNLILDYVLITHGHFDHVFEAAAFVEATGAALAIHPADLPLLQRLPETAEGWGYPGAQPAPAPQLLLAHGQRLKLGLHELEVRHTPGHSPGGVAFIFTGNAVVGDTLFHRGIGRWDLPGADYHALERSIREQLYTLPAETVVWPGHGPSTTIGEELRFNPYVGEGARFTPKV